MMRVLISGAGVAGPALAWWLARAGMSVTILEKEADNMSKGQNIDIRGSAIELIRRMGLLEEVRRCNTGEMGTAFLGPNGETFALFPADVNGMTAEFEILRGDLATILYNATKDDSDTTYRFGTTIAEVLSNDYKSVRVRLSTGDVEEYDLLVLADGQWSQTRRSVFSSDQIGVTDLNVYIAFFTIPRSKEDGKTWEIYHALDSRILSTRPDPHGTTRALLGTTPLNAEQKKAWETASRSDRQAKEDILRKHFAGCGWQTERLMEGMSQSSDFYFSASKQIKMKTWSKGRVVCLGDTAWAPTSLTGMGTSLALDGAYVLAGSLSQLQDGQHPSSALEAFQASFHPFVQRSQYVPSIVTWLVYPRTSLGRWLLQTTIQAAHSVGPWVIKLIALWPRSKAKDSKPKMDFDLPHYPVFAKFLQ